MERKKGIYEKYIKRPQDFICALLAVIVLSPIIILLAVLVKVKLGSPIFYRQERPGKNEKIFVLYKFRSMTNERNECGELLPDSERLTTFGKWLRSSSLDELPELYNILKGDMAVVGPRPLLVRYLEFYEGEERMRHLVRPGITGLAQVSGRNAISWEKKFDKDIEYVKHITFLNDWIIIFKTVLVVLKRKGISSMTSETMEPFQRERMHMQVQGQEHVRDLVIIGAGGLGREVAFLVERINQQKRSWNLLGFLDDRKEELNHKVGKYEIIGTCKELPAYQNVWVVCAIANTNARRNIITSFKNNQIQYATLIDPSVIYSDTTVIGEGSIICVGATLTIDINIGMHTIINPNCTIGHDACLKDFVTLYPGVNVSGNVRIGECVEIGTGSQIIQGLEICDDVIVGAGAVIHKNIKTAGTYVGVPAACIVRT